MAVRKNMIFLIIAAVLVSQIFISQKSWGEVFNVTNVAELRQALATADSNGQDDIINLAAGTYSTNGMPFVYQAEASENFTITLIGTGVTILDGGNLDRVLSIDTNSVTDSSNTDIAISSLTILNGNTTRAAGGLIIISNSPSVTIENCQISNNIAASSGAGAFITADSVALGSNIFSNNNASADGAAAYIAAGIVRLTGNTFINNAANGRGGAIFVPNAQNSTLSGNKFEQNTSVAADGGAAYINSDAVTLSQNNSFMNNSAEANGGAVFVTAALNVNFSDNLFENNTANQNGGAAHINASSQTTMDKNTFNGNGSGLDGGGASIVGNGNANLNANLFMNNVSNREGGGFASSSDIATLTNNIFIKNASINSGGAAYVLASIANLTNNTMTLNSSAGYGGGLSLALTNDTDTANIFNNIIYDNTSQTSGHDDIFVDDDRNLNRLGSFVNLFNNDFTEFFSSCENFIACDARISRGNNIDTDPLFVDAASGDVHLTQNSPAIDNGSPNAPNLPSTDFEGNPRVIGPAPDMGALEFVGEAPSLDVLIEKTGNVNSIPPNRESEIIYTIRIENVGEENATDVSVEDSLPPGAVVQSLTAGCAETQPETITCEVGVLPNGDERVFEITIRITPNAQSIINEASVDFDSRLRMTSLTIPVVSTPNVLIEKTANVTTIERGGSTRIIYTIRIGSDGDEEARDVVVIDDLPEGSTLVESSQGCSEDDPGTVVCNVGNLPVGEERTLNITIDITPRSASILNEAIVEFLGGVNSDSVRIMVTGGGAGASGTGCSLAESHQHFDSNLSALILLLPVSIIAFRISFRKACRRLLRQT